MAKNTGKPDSPPNKDIGVVSFGKLFLHFVATPLAKNLGSDVELQIFFYSMNNSCGPMGSGKVTHSIAEFPIEMDVFRAAYEDKLRSTNSSALTAEEFLRIVIESQFMDMRAIGYGRKTLYKGWDKNKPKEPIAPDNGKGALDAANKWANEYGDMKLPMIEMVMDPEVRNKDNNRIRKIHIYDRQSSPYEALNKENSREEQKLILERGVPVITPGTNGTLVINSTISSKTDGTQGSIYLLRAMGTTNKGGQAQTSESGLEEEGHLPLRTLPVQVTLSTFGVPTARLYQSYFIDFNTGTTLDNLYVCTQIQHNIVPGKFTTSWTFAYTNGYGRFSNNPQKTSIVPESPKVVDNRTAQTAPKKSK